MMEDRTSDARGDYVTGAKAEAGEVSAVRAPAFFVPYATPEILEVTYADFAGMCQVAVPEPGERIYSITFSRGGEEWTATVGEPLRGVRYGHSRVRGKRRVCMSDPAIVLAIFAGDPFRVVTHQGLARDVGSAWANPFFVGQPSATTYFSITP